MQDRTGKQQNIRKVILGQGEHQHLPQYFLKYYGYQKTQTQIQTQHR